LFDRLVGVFKLDKICFEEIEHDKNATFQAFLIVVVISLMSSLGGGISASLRNQSFFGSFFVLLVWSFFGWLLWSVVSHLVGTAFFGGKGSLIGMLRLVGYAFVPQLLGIIPCIGLIIGWIWSLLAGFVAVRQGLDLDNFKTFLTTAAGFLVYVVGYIFITIFLFSIR
jgi:hypothetical protein